MNGNLKDSLKKAVHTIDLNTVGWWNLGKHASLSRRWGSRDKRNI